MGRLFEKDKNGFSLIELMVVASVISLITLIAVNTWDIFRASRANLAARQEATSLLELLSNRVSRIHRAGEDQSYKQLPKIRSCLGAPSTCATISRKIYSNTETKREINRFKNVCLPVNKEGAVFLGMPQSLYELCAIGCPDRHRPAVLVESWLENDVSKMKRQLYPSVDSFRLSSAVSAGFCLKYNGESISSIVFGVGYLQENSEIGKMHLLRKELFLPVEGDNLDHIEWMQ